MNRKLRIGLMSILLLGLALPSAVQAADPDLLRFTAEALAAPWQDSGITRVLGIEARGFIWTGSSCGID